MVCDRFYTKQFLVTGIIKFLQPCLGTNLVCTDTLNLDTCTDQSFCIIEIKEFFQKIDQEFFQIISSNFKGHRLVLLAGTYLPHNVEKSLGGRLKDLFFCVAPDFKTGISSMFNDTV